MQRLSSRISIVWLATAATLVPLVVMALLLLWIFSRSVERTTETLGRQVIDATTQRVEESLTNNLEHARGLSDSLTELIQDGTFDVHDRVKWRSRLLAHLRGNTDVSAIMFMDPERRLVFMARYSDGFEFGETEPDALAMTTYSISLAGELDPNSRRVARYDARERPWYQIAMRSPTPVWTAAYATFTGAQRLPMREIGVGYTRVIRPRDAATSQPDADAPMLGILLVKLSVPQINNALRRIAIPFNATLLVTDESGERLGASSAIAGPRGSFNTQIDPALEKALADRHNDVSTAAVGLVQNVVPLDVDGHPYWISEAPLRASSNTQWRLTVALPQQAILGDARAYAWSISTVSAAIVVITAGCAALLTYQLAGPFRRLASFAGEVGDGKFGNKINTAGCREVSQLSVALNTMASNLGERVALLAQKDAAVSANAMKARLIAHVSHEFRTPLNSIIGYAELLHEDALAEARARDASDAANIVTASRHLLSLVEGLLDLSTIEAKRLRLETCDFSIAELLDEVATNSRPVVEKNRNRLHVLGPPVEVRMTADPTRMRQILINLVANAGKYCSNGRVALSAQLTDPADDAGLEQVVFTVTDTGPGIPTELVARLFEPFASLAVVRHTGTSRPGAGLGLAITHQLTRSMGGNVHVDTGSSGTRMRITMPLHGTAAGWETAAVEAGGSSVNSLG